MRKNLSKPRAPHAVLALIAIPLLALPAGPAYAFKIFGLDIFGSDAEKPDDIANPVRYSVDLTVGDKDLVKPLQTASQLYQDKDKPVSGDLGVVVKARDDRQRLVATLYENARYGAVVTIKVAGTDIDALPPVPVFPHDKPVPVSISVDPGPVFKIGQVHLTGDAATLDPTVYGLKPGAVASSALVLDAANRIVAALEEQGRPLAKLTERNLVADHATNTVEITIGATGGPKANIGPVTVSGSKLVNSEFVAKWSRLHEGKPYSPQDMVDAADRLRKLGVFSSVVITKSARLDQNGEVPMAIQVADGKQRYFGVGVQYSSLDGAGLLGYWGHRNLFGNGESLKITGSVSRLLEASSFKDLDYSVSILYSKPAAFSETSTFNASLTAAAVHPDTYRSASLDGNTNVAIELNKQDTLTGGLDLTWSQTEDTYGKATYLVSSVPISWARDASDDKLNPTTGYRLNLLATPSYEIYGSNLFSSLEGSVTAYRPMGTDDTVVLAGKLAAGTLFSVENLSDIPATRRFYEGGGGSVRGYTYQEISPYNAAGEALGGRSYMLASFEARVKITDTIGLVPFIDAGTVGLGLTPNFNDIRAGAGLGLRYATPFGPLRLDVAVPLKRYTNGSTFGIYAGIGQSF
jgi:translocation and assembly module TamA